ncbi:DUF1876 domain-containing protein [Streptomyces sp. HC44]|uniref:DUF1876 domain-containing protein n=1 Tax=Streptomyces scabichelini TaxID=2711217 RepID=A0A6G4V018_9ACTN|nr:DUF1876 domain-containing protein [Streptomyces scabichelini]NGO07341.1 DUF1876 domain-containing protein [Streptomyces scabichelini]
MQAHQAHQAHLNWHIDLDIDRSDTESEATATLQLPDTTRLTTHGHARRNPDDPDQAQVGEELAAARALNDLARRLLRKAAHEIEEATHSPAHPHP